MPRTCWGVAAAASKAGHRLAWSILASVLALAVPAAGEELWYVVEVGGEAAGWMVARESVGDDGEVVTESILRLGFQRAGSAQTVGLASRFVETADGRPVSAWSRQELGAVPVEAEYAYGEESVVAVFRQGDAERREEVPLPSGEWLTPGRLQATIAARLAAGDAEFTVRTVDPLVGVQPLAVTWRRVAEEVAVEVDGETRTASRWRQEQSVAPGLGTVVDVAADGLLLRSETPLLGTAMTVRLASREAALASQGTPELLVASFITPDRPLPGARRLDRAVFALSLAGGGAPELPSTGAQRVATDDGRALVTVDVGTTEPADGVDRARHLAATTWLDHDAEAVATLAATALEGVPAEAGDALRAERLRVFVARHLDRKDLNSILATASEAAATRSGDCTEHAVLLAALLRRAGIPSRVVTGLVYVDRFAGAADVFGYHMWTQAVLDGRWVDLDATLERRFDAAHVALSTSALGDEESALMAVGEVASLIGRLELAVVQPAE